MVLKDLKHTLTENDVRQHYFAIGSDAYKTIASTRHVKLVCSGKIYENRAVDHSKGSGHIYARKEFFDDFHLCAGKILFFDVDNVTNTITITRII